MTSRLKLEAIPLVYIQFGLLTYEKLLQLLLDLLLSAILPQVLWFIQVIEESRQTALRHHITLKTSVQGTW
jgi:hypothetical protein